MPESLTFRFVDGGGGGSGTPSGGSPTASQFGSRESPAAPSAPGRTTSDRIEDRQSREPAKAETPPIPRVDEPIAPSAPSAPSAPKAPTVGPEAPAAPKAPSLPAGPPPRILPKVSTRDAMQQVADSQIAKAERASAAATRASLVRSASVVAGGAATTAGLAGAAAAGVGIVAAGVGSAAFAAKALGDSVSSTIGDFSPEVARARAQVETSQTRQAVRLAEDVGQETARFETLKGILGGLFKEAKAEVFKDLQPLIEGLTVGALLFPAWITGDAKEYLKALRNIERILESSSDGGNSLFDRPHLEPPGFDGELIRAGGTPENAPRGLEF